MADVTFSDSGNHKIGPLHSSSSPSHVVILCVCSCYCNTTRKVCSQLVGGGAIFLCHLLLSTVCVCVCVYPGQLDAAGLGVFTNFWSYISEATKAEDDDQSTWTLYPPEVRWLLPPSPPHHPHVMCPQTTASMGLPGRDLLGDVSISFSKENSIIPHTIGPKQKPPGEVRGWKGLHNVTVVTFLPLPCPLQECMVVFYCNADNVRNKVAQFVHQLKHQSSVSVKGSIMKV